MMNGIFFYFIFVGGYNVFFFCKIFYFDFRYIDIVLKFFYGDKIIFKLYLVLFLWNLVNVDVYDLLFILFD